MTVSHSYVVNITTCVSTSGLLRVRVEVNQNCMDSSCGLVANSFVSNLISSNGSWETGKVCRKHLRLLEEGGFVVSSGMRFAYPSGNLLNRRY